MFEDHINTRDTHTGRQKADKKDEENTRTHPNGDKYVKNCANNVRHGNGKDGGAYEGVDGKRRRWGTYIYPDGGQYEGDWVDGRRHGTGKFTYRDGSVYEGGFRAGKRWGWGTYIYIYPNGDEYVGEWVNNVRHGNGKLTYRDGSVYEGNFEDGKLQGWGTYIYPSGNKYAGEWENGERHGSGTYTLSNGNTYTGQWENNTIRVYVEKVKKENTVPTVIFRSTKVSKEKHALKYEENKFLHGGKGITVIQMSRGDKLDKLLAENGFLKRHHGDKVRFIMNEHGRRNGTSEIKHTKKHFKNLLTLCAEQDIRKIVFSDDSCFGSATKHLQDAKVPDGMSIKRHWCDREHSLFTVSCHDPQGQTRIVYRWFDKEGKIRKRHKSFYKNGKWTTERQF